MPLTRCNGSRLTTPEAGAHEVRFDIAFTSPCKIERNDSHSVHNILNTTYDRLGKLCSDEYEEVISMIQSLAGCLPADNVGPRKKRAVPFIVGSMLFSAVVGLFATYKVEQRFDGIQNRTDYLNNLLMDVRDNQLNLIVLTNSTLMMAKENKQAILEQATITPEVA